MFTVLHSGCAAPVVSVNANTLAWVITWPSTTCRERCSTLSGGKVEWGASAQRRQSAARRGVSRPMNERMAAIACTDTLNIWGHIYPTECADGMDTCFYFVSCWVGVLHLIGTLKAIVFFSCRLCMAIKKLACNNWMLLWVCCFVFTTAENS